jgi:hypothetical protein
MTGCSASWTIDRVLAQGVVSAHWVQVSAFSGGAVLVHEDPAACFRLTVRTSGAATVDIMAMQSGPERVN